MRNRLNPLYVQDSIKIMRKAIKHPAMIKSFAYPNYNATTDKPTKFIGVDFETDPATGELKLMGAYASNYKYFYSKNTDLLFSLCTIIKKAVDEDFTIVHWSRFDQNSIAKLFFLSLPKEDLRRALERYGKHTALWDRENHEWITEPIVKVKYVIKNKEYEFGIMSIIDKKIITVYMLNDQFKNPRRVSVIDMMGLYKTSLLKACESKNIPYSKMQEGYQIDGKTFSYHIIDWKMFEKDLIYQKGVLESNRMDSMAVKLLSSSYINDFYRTFKKYPKTIFSSGSLAKMALTCILNKNDFTSLNFYEQLKDWKYDKNRLLLDKLHILACECYSGGVFELYAIGTSDAWIADISACYPSAIEKLPDLRGSEVIEGFGEPPIPEKNDVILIRGTVHSPESVLHTFRIRNPEPLQHHKICRPFGTFRTCYIWEEREFAKMQGATFSDEEYIIIRTTGKQSPLAIASNRLYDMRMELRKKNDTAQSIAKDANNSCYGITIEGIKTYRYDDKRHKYIFDGFKAGQLYNPLLATLITAYARITLCTGLLKIRENGGILIQANTDSIHWKGRKSDLPENFDTLVGKCGWRKEKTRGYFEEPVLIKDFISLATGRYGGYDTVKKKYFCKLRSYSVDYDPNNHLLKKFLSEMKDLPYCKRVLVQTNNLISILQAKARRKLTLDEVCRIDGIEKYMDLVCTDGKKHCTLINMDNPIKTILKKLTLTVPINADDFRIDPYIPINKLNIETLKMSMSSEEFMRKKWRKAKRKYTDEENEAKKKKRKEARRKYTDEEKEAKKKENAIKRKEAEKIRLKLYRKRSENSPKTIRSGGADGSGKN